MCFGEAATPTEKEKKQKAKAKKAVLRRALWSSAHKKSSWSMEHGWDEKKAKLAKRKIGKTKFFETKSAGAVRPITTFNLCNNLLT